MKLKDSPSGLASAFPAHFFQAISLRKHSACAHFDTWYLWLDWEIIFLLTRQKTKVINLPDCFFWAQKMEVDKWPFLDDGSVPNKLTEHCINFSSLAGWSGKHQKNKQSCGGKLRRDELFLVLGRWHDKLGLKTISNTENPWPDHWTLRLVLFSICAQQVSQVCWPFLRPFIVCVFPCYLALLLVKCAVQSLFLTSFQCPFCSESWCNSQYWSKCLLLDCSHDDTGRFLVVWFCAPLPDPLPQNLFSKATFARAEAACCHVGHPWWSGQTRKPKHLANLTVRLVRISPVDFSKVRVSGWIA